MLDQRNLILAVVLSVAIIIVFQMFLTPEPDERQLPAEGQVTAGKTDPGARAPTGGAPPTVPAPAPGAVPTPAPGPTPAQEGQTAAPQLAVPAPGAPPAPGTSAEAAAAANRKAALARTRRVKVVSNRLHGSISLRGGRIDDLTLADYRIDLDPNSAEIILLSPTGVPSAYFAQFGWVAGDKDVAVPGTDTEWRADGNTIAPGKPVTLSWDNGKGMVFTRILTLDEDYVFTVTQRVENRTDKAARLFPYGLISRTDTPDVLGFYILHEGPLGVFDGTLKEVDYDDLVDDGPVEVKDKTGWIGITDKYWLVALLPDPKMKITGRFFHEKRGETDKYQVDYLAAALDLPARGRVETTNYLFAGAKLVDMLDGYSERLGIANFDKSIDFGWFYFLTKPLFKILLVFNNFIGNMGVAILLLTVGVKILFFPLANKSYRSMSKMKALQPEMLKLRERFSDDKTQLNQEMMALYKRHKVTPASGCLPMLIQIPVFFALYKVLFVTIEMRQAPFFGWIKDLSVPDPTSMFNLFGLLPWEPASVSPMLLIGVWPLIMGGSMFLQQKLNPQPPDPVQAKIFLFLPLMFTVMLARFPAGLVIYWAWNNTLSIAQQWLIMKKMGVAKPAS